MPVSSPFCRWIRELAARSVTGGCGGGNYCPAASVTREQMAVFLLRTLQGAAYIPPACTSSHVQRRALLQPLRDLDQRAGAPRHHGRMRWGLFCPTSPNTRAQMAIFLTTTFGLPLPN